MRRFQRNVSFVIPPDLGQIEQTDEYIISDLAESSDVTSWSQLEWMWSKISVRFTVKRVAGTSIRPGNDFSGLFLNRVVQCTSCIRRSSFYELSAMLTTGC